MKLSQYDLYKKLIPWLFVYMFIFMFFYIRKLSVKSNVGQNFEINSFSLITATLSILLGIGLLYFLNKKNKFDSYKKILILSQKDRLTKSIILIGTVFLTSILLYIFY